ncbi:hypothetical protein M0Q97_02235 [Candidatus Dojkabacteria bacterium]|jgi:hypothetical protein|nr:hypothetical protein [Candidatus Dojkabacteria bacterium]
MESLEQNYQKQLQFEFFKKTGEYLNSLLEEDKLIPILEGEIEADTQINLNLYKTMGSIAYLVGLDFTSQQYLKEEVVKNVFMRFTESFKLNDESVSKEVKEAKLKSLEKVFELFASRLFQITEENVQEAKNKMSNSIEKFILNKEVNQTFKMSFLNIFQLAKSLINSGIIKTNLSVDVNNILNKKLENISYLDITKINTLIHNDLNFFGKSINKYIKLYQSDLWAILLEDAVQRIDQQKFSIIYLDSILTLKEKTPTLNYMTDGDLIFEDSRFLSDILINIIKNNEIPYEIIKEDYDKRMVEVVHPEQIENEPVVEDEIGLATQDELTKMIHENPDAAVIEIFKDICKTPNITNDLIIKSIDYLMENLDYASNLYHFFVTKINDKRTYIFGDNIDIDLLRIKLQEKYDLLQNNYKKSVENSCGEIDEITLKEIIKMLDEVINYIMLPNSEEKTYFISQKFENSISTYNHLHQMISILENVEILLEGIPYYLKLYNYLNDNPKVKENFEIIANIEQYTTQIKIFGAIKKWYDNPEIEPIENPENKTTE